MKQTALILFLFLGVAAVGAVWWIWQDMQKQLHAPLALKSELFFTIEPGMTLQKIGDELHRRGVLRQPYYLLLEARRQGKERQIKAGEYSLLPGTTPLEMLDQFVAGKVVQHALKLLEGWTFAQVMVAVQANQHLTHTLPEADTETLMAALGTPSAHPEGQFFPDTYHFPAGTTDLAFLSRARERMQEVLAGEWQSRAEGLPYPSPYEALIMASIVEKETGLAEERGKIAGVLLRRLERNMKLQVDPTVIYALGDGFDGNLRRDDLDFDSPYNTYRYPGLPPTPIAMPGLESLRAALHPEAGNALYFVAKGDGSHHFSATLNDHNSAVARYQRGENEGGD